MTNLVKLEVSGKRATLDNNIIKITFNKKGHVDSLIKNNTELVSNLSGASTDPNKTDTFYVDYYGNGKFRNINVSELKIIKNTKDEAHIAYIDNSGLLRIEYHSILRSNESGIYSYIIASKNCKDELTVNELRTVYRFDSNIFTHSFNGERIDSQPIHINLAKGEKLQDETYKDCHGNIYTKYDYSNYYKDIDFWGQFGNRFGVWFIPVSTEYYPSGPLKQELLVHYNSIILNYMQGAHFGTGNLEVKDGWSKFYGPWYIYINEGSFDALIDDAKKKSSIEKTKWPYTWVEEDLYPINRGCIYGKLSLPDNLSTLGATIVLTKNKGEIIRQKEDYIYYTETDNLGSFNISNIRCGNYHLYAYLNDGHITEEFHIENIVINEGINNIGDISWVPKSHKEFLWQIGKSDRMSSEFKYSNEYRSYNWMSKVPSDLTFEIGKNNESLDWYYAQTKKGNWNINFNIDNVGNKNYYLTLAMSSASSMVIGSPHVPNLIVKINNNKIKELVFENDTTIYRSGMKSGRYHNNKLIIDNKFLKSGVNTISLEADNGAFMYDTIILESDNCPTINSILQLLKCFEASKKINPFTFNFLLNALNNLSSSKDLENDKHAIVNYINSTNESAYIKLILKKSIDNIKTN